MCFALVYEMIVSDWWLVPRCSNYDRRAKVMMILRMMMRRTRRRRMQRARAPRRGRAAATAPPRPRSKRAQVSLYIPIIIDENNISVCITSVIHSLRDSSMRRWIGG